MLQRLLTKAPIIAVLASLILFVIVAGAGMGLEWPILLATASTFFAGSEAWVIWVAVQQKRQADKHLRHIRFIADRFQSLVRVAPGGYCLFTPQGLLREEHGVAAKLGIMKLSHLDDLIEGVKEGPELLEKFRRLQMTGEEFETKAHSSKDNHQLFIIGRRFRIGREGPHVDVLWFYDQKASVMQGELRQSRLLKQAAKDFSALKEETPLKDSSKDQKEKTKTQETPREDQELCEEDFQDFRLSCQALINLYPFPVWARDNKGELVLCNEAYCKAVALSHDEIIKDQHEIVPPSHKVSGSREVAEKLLKERQPQTYREHVVIDGRRRFMEITELLAPKASIKAGMPLVVLGFAVDVTSEEEKDTELKRHMAANHEILENLGAAISVYGPDRRLEFYNRAYLQLWGAKESFLDEKPTFGEVLEDMRARRKIPEQADFRKYKQERASKFTSLLESYEEVMYLPDGTSLRMLTAPHPMGGLMFVYENVTDQLALETSYNTLMAVQRESFDNLAEGIAVYGPDGKLRLFNNSLVRLLKLPKEFLEEEPHVSQLIEECRELLDDKQQDWEAYKSTMVGYALDRKSRGGRVECTNDVIVEYRTVPLPDGSVLNSFIDVTDSVRVEQALRASNAALATADRLKSDFVANVSYQLRTPLNTITGFAEILTEQYFGRLNDRQLEYTTTIKAESEKLSRLINDVLDLATIEAGRMTLDRHTIDIAVLLNEAKQMTAEWARQQSLDILIECPSDIGVFDVDEHRMKQVLFNLISNAIKYTPAGGNIALAAWRQEDWVVLSVLDTGVGIPEADQERVFGKFERSNDHLRQAGAGLGLSLVKSFVELHGGRVEILSDARDGTRISCFIPQKAVKSVEDAKEEV